MSFKNRHKQNKHRSFDFLRTPAFWKPFEEYNHQDSRLRAEALKTLGIEETNPEILRILTKSHFVIPGSTRFACQKCGECCRYARKVANFTYEPCPFLTADNACEKHDRNYQVCRWFPFWAYADPRLGPLLTIKPYCSGYGKGSPVDYLATLRHITELATVSSAEDDGAVVFHELLYLPDLKEWVFPSKQNVDSLMQALQKQKVPQAAEPPERNAAGMLQYAHDYTSGLLGSIQEPQLTLNEHGLITDVNEAFCKMSRRERSRLIGQGFPTLFVNPDRVSACVTACLSRGKETAIPLRLQLPDRITAPVILNAMVFREASDGLIHGILVCVQAVSVTLFNEIAHTRNYARNLLEASLDALVALDLDGVITDVNEACVVMTGRPREGLLGTKFETYFDDVLKARLGVEKTRTQGQVKNYELNLIQALGQVIPVSFNATVYTSEEGGISGIFAAARDMRETKKLIQNLEESKNYSRGLIESSIDLMVMIDRHGIITDANESAVQMTGIPREKLIESVFSQHFDDPKRAQQGVDLTFETGHVHLYELNLLSALESPIPVSFNATLYKSPDGAVQGVFGIARDIRERKRALQELEEARNYARGLIESSIDLMVTIDRQGMIMDVNQAAEQMTGRTRAQLIGSPFKNHFDAPQAAQRGVDLTYETGRVTNYKLNLINTSENVVPVSFNATLFRDAKGGIQGIFAVARA